MSCDEDNVVILFSWQFLLNSGINYNKKLTIWVHKINKIHIPTKNNTIFNFLSELLEDELKFKNSTLEFKNFWFISKN